MRLFLAIELTTAGPAGASAPAHLTVKFLGEVRPDQLPAISAAVAEAVRDRPPFDLLLEGVGAFPSRDHPRVVWVGATRGATEVADVAARIATALVPLGFPRERGRFVPHLTLFRVRSPGERRRAEALLSGAEPAPPTREVRVTEVVLKESTLTPRGAIHQTRATFPLGGGRPG